MNKTHKMKKQDYIALGSALLYTFLFHNQLPGINYLIFSVVMVAIIFINNLSLLNKPAVLITAAGTLVSGVIVFYYSTDLAIVANLSSLLALGALSINPQSSLIVSMLHSAYSIILTIPLALVKRLEDNPAEAPTANNENETNWQKLMIGGVVFFIVMLFFILYKDASPVFSKISESINFNFISGKLIMFFIVSFLVLFGFFRQNVIDWLFNNDNTSSDKLKVITEEEHLQTYTGVVLGLKNEVFAGVLLLVLLNLLLAVVNGIDIFYSIGSQKLPDGMTLADYLHDGTNSIIASIIFAVAIILFFFRGYLNYAPQSKALKLLTYAWIAQNIILVLTTCNRNFIYIDTYGLTYKRVGVYIFLFLCIAGLVTTFIKVIAAKSNWFLFRKNGWIFYIVLLVYSCFNWDVIIANHNIAQVKSKQKVDLDYYYLFGLKNALPELLAFYEEQYALNDSDPLMHHGNTAFEESLNADVATLTYRIQGYGPQSTCLIQKQNWNDIMAMYNKGHYKFIKANSFAITAAPSADVVTSTQSE
jgi:hypothetical protein